MCSITPNAEDANGPRRVLGEEAIVEAVDEEINLLQARQSLQHTRGDPSPLIETRRCAHSIGGPAMA
jgi:hypothetical protein